MSNPGPFDFTFDHLIPGTETGEWSDFVAIFTVSAGRPQGLNRPAEPAGVEIEDIFMLEGEERLQIDDDAFESLSEMLAGRHDEMLEMADREAESAILDAGDHRRELAEDLDCV